MAPAGDQPREEDDNGGPERQTQVDEEALLHQSLTLEGMPSRCGFTLSRVQDPYLTGTRAPSIA